MKIHVADSWCSGFLNSAQNSYFPTFGRSTAVAVTWMKRPLPSLQSWAQLPPHEIDSHSRPRARDRRERRDMPDRQISNPSKHIVSARLAFLACRAFGARLNHKVHQLFFDIDNLLRFLALQPLRDLYASQPFHLLASGVGSHVKFGPQLSIHLDRNS